MLKLKTSGLVMIGFFVLVILSACGFTIEENEGSKNSAEGTMPADQEAPEYTGMLESIESPEEVLISIDGQTETYRLSADAKSQVQAEEVTVGNEVTFTTYSIGDNKKTIDKFIE